MTPDTLKQLNAHRTAGTAVAVVTDRETGQQSLVTLEHGESSVADIAAVRAMLSQDLSGPLSEDSPVFVRSYNPPLKLVVVGAVHIAQSLVPMAALAGFAVTVIDPREGFVSAGRFDQVTVIEAWPDEGMAQIKLDHRTAVVTLTHDPKLDDPALAAALNSDVFYIGALGSKRTHAKREQRLTGEGFSEEQMARINGPIGLRIGAKSPAEIAVSILGQIIDTHRNRD